VTNNPYITGAAASTGNGFDLGSPIVQTLTNTSDTARKVTYTLTPHVIDANSNNACPFDSIKVDVWVEPTVKITATNDTICNGTPTDIQPKSKQVPTKGIRYTWTVTSNPYITGATASTGNGFDLGSPIVQTLTNTSDTARKVTYTLTPHVIDANGNNACPFDSIKVDVWVEPTVKITATNDTICNGTPTDIQPKSKQVPTKGIRYTWTVTSNPYITGATASTGNGFDLGSPIVQTLTNTSDTARKVTYTLTPHVIDANGNNACPFDSIKVDVWVEPTVKITAANDTICNGTPTDIQPKSKQVPTKGIRYTWTVTSNPYITGAAASTGNGFDLGSPIVQSLTNTSDTARKVTYTLTPHVIDANGNNACPFDSIKVDVWVEPTVKITATNDTLCNGTPTNIQPKSKQVPTKGIRYTWTVTSNPYITGSTASTGNGFDLGSPIVQTLTNTGDTARKVTYTLTPHVIDANGNNACPFDSIKVDVWVEPTFRYTFTVDDTICSGTTITFKADTLSHTLGNYRYDLKTSPSGAAGDITGYSPSATNIPFTNFSNTLYDSVLSYRSVRYTFAPKITYNNSSRICYNKRDTSITVYVNPVPRMKVDLSNVHKNNDSICFNEGNKFVITYLNDTVIGTKAYELEVNYKTGTVTGVETAPSRHTNITELDQSLLQNTSDSIQTLTYIFKPVILGYSGNSNCDNGIADTSLLTIAPKIKFGFDTLSKYRYHGRYIRCFGEKNGAVILDDLAGGFYNRTPNPYGYSWSTGSKADSAWNLQANIYYKITVTDKLGCFRTDSVILTQPDVLTIPSSGWVIKQNLCKGTQDGAINITPTGGTQAYTYKWWNSIGYSSNEQNIDSLYGGRYYYVIINDVNKCTYKDSALLKTPIQYTRGGSRSNYGGYQIKCNGNSDGSIRLRGGDFVIQTIHWTGPDGYTNDTVYITDLKAGLYTAVMKSKEGCEATDTLNMVEPAPLIVLYDTNLKYSNGFDVQCYGGNNGRVLLKPQGGHGNYTYVWSGGSGYIQGNKSQSALTAGAYTIVVMDHYATLTGASFCSATKELILTQPNPLVINAVLPVPNNAYKYNLRCKNGSDGEIILNAIGGIGAIAYHWTPPAGVVLINPDSANQQNLKAGTYKATLTYSNGACKVDTFYTLTEPDSIRINLKSIENNVCYGESRGRIQFYGVTGGVGDYSYNWSPTSGGIVQNQLDQNWLKAGTYRLDVKDGNQVCSTNQSFTIAQPLQIGVAFTIVPVSCSNGTNGLIYANVSGGTPDYLYSWADFPGLSNDTAFNVTKGDHLLRITDSNRCIFDTLATMPAPDSLKIDFKILSDYNDSSVRCFGGKDGSAEVIVNGGTRPYQYTWSNGATVSRIDTLNANEKYTVTVMDSKNCPGKVEFKLSQPDPLKYTYTKVDNICYGYANGSVNGEASGGISPYTFIWNDGQTGKDRSLLPYREGGYQLSLVDANNCRLPVTIEIEQPSAIKVDTSIRFPYCPDTDDGYIELKISGGTGVYYKTVFTRLNDNAKFYTNPLDMLGFGMYAYIVTDEAGCFKRDTILLSPKMGACMDIPNAFSPNDDGKNDEWIIYAGKPDENRPLGSIYPKAIVEVFNRWGELIYRSEPGYLHPWNGTYKGRPLPLDSYYYVIDPKNGSRPVSGIITIVK
jgi:gliding motility-associated-like protein